MMQTSPDLSKTPSNLLNAPASYQLAAPSQDLPLHNSSTDLYEVQDSASVPDEWVALYNETEMSLDFVSKDYPITEQCFTRQTLDPFISQFGFNIPCVQMLALSGTNLLFIARDNPRAHEYTLSLYYVGKRKANILQKYVNPNAEQFLTDFSFNVRRGLLAGAADCAKSISYHLWKPSNERGLQLLWATREAVTLDYSDHLIRSLDFTRRGDLIATLSQRMTLFIDTVDSNERRVQISLFPDDYEDRKPAMQRNSCRWNWDCTAVFCCFGLYPAKFCLVDPEKREFLLESQKSFHIKGLEVSPLQPNLVACTLDLEGNVLLYDTRISLRFPTAHLQHGSNPIVTRERSIYHDPNGNTSYVRRANCDISWSSINAHELLSITSEEVAIFDTRKQSYNTVILNPSQFSCCAFVYQ